MINSDLRHFRPAPTRGLWRAFWRGALVALLFTAACGSIYIAVAAVFSLT